MTAFKALSDAASKIGDQQSLNDSALASGQRWGIVHLYGQKKLGELTSEMPKARGFLEGRKSKMETYSDRGLGKNGVSDTERIARNPEILDRIIETAKERGEIPTKTAVLNTIKVEEMRKRDKERVEKHHDRIENERDKSVAEYYEGIKGFKAVLDFAIIAAERDKFDASGKNFLIKKNNEIRTMMDKLEELV